MRKIYRIYDHRTYLLIANTKASRDHHSHFTVIGKNKQSVKDTCHMLIRIMEQKRIPKSSFLLRSAIRIVSDKRYKNKLLTELERRIEKEGK